MIKHNKNQLELQLLGRLKEDCEKSFSILFHTYYKDLVLFAGNIIKDKHICEDIVQSIFFKLWNDRETLVIESSVKSYLLRSVRNSCMDEIRHRKVVSNYESQMLKMMEIDESENYILYSDLYEHLTNAIEQLPEKHREVFKLSRFEELKYKEIAQMLNISERTVEDRISKALIQLRIKMKDFLVTFFIIFFNL